MYQLMHNNVNQQCESVVAQPCKPKDVPHSGPVDVQHNQWVHNSVIKPMGVPYCGPIDVH